jgi:hypothetical protein
MLRLPLAPAQLLNYWREAPGMTAAFVRQFAPQARFIILGHTHWSGLWTIDGRVVINTGAFRFPGRPRMVRIEQDTLSVVPIKQRWGECRPGSPVIARYALDEAADPSALNTRPGSVRPRAKAA